MSYRPPAIAVSGRTQSYVSPFTSSVVFGGAAPASGAYDAQNRAFYYPITVPSNAVLDQFWMAVATGQTPNAAAYAASTWVGVGSSGWIATSTDGTAWTKRTSGTTQTLNAVAYGGGTWVAVGNSGTVLTSSDAVTWSAASSPGFGTNAINSVAYGGTTWVAVGNGGSVRYATSPAGTWTGASAPGFGSGNVFNVAYGGSAWVAGGQTPYLKTATDPTGTWTTPTSVGFTANVYSIAYGGTTWVAGDISGNVRTTTDPTATWAAASSAGFGGNGVYGLAYDGSTYWVGAGAGGVNNVRYTTNPGGTWTTAASVTNPQFFNAVVYGNGRWIVQTANGRPFLSSTDATTGYSQTWWQWQVGLYKADGSQMVLGTTTSSTTPTRLVYDASKTGTSIPAGSYYLALWTSDYGLGGFLRSSDTANRLRARFLESSLTAGLPSTITAAQDTTGLVYLFGFTTK